MGPFRKRSRPAAESGRRLSAARGPGEVVRKLIVVEPERDRRWDEFVGLHPQGSIYHHSAWARVLRLTFGYEPFHMALERSLGEPFEGILPLMLINSRLTGKRLVSLPLSTCCSPLMPAEALDWAVRFALEQCPGCAFLELRSLGASGVAPAWLQSHSRYVTHLLGLGPGLAELFKAFHGTSIRQRIKRAEKNGVKLRLAETEEGLKAFFRLHTRVRRKHGLPPQPYRFFANMWRVLKPPGMLLVPLLEHGGEVIAGAVVLRFKDTFIYEYSAADQARLDLGPNQLLIWEVIKLACQSGARTLDLGRTVRSHQSLIDFKARWGARCEPLVHYYCPEAKRVETETGLARHVLGSVNRWLPAWALRLEGRLLYHHLG